MHQRTRSPSGRARRRSPSANVQCGWRTASTGPCRASTLTAAGRRRSFSVPPHGASSRRTAPSGRHRATPCARQTAVAAVALRRRDVRTHWLSAGMLLGGATLLASSAVAPASNDATKGGTLRLSAPFDVDSLDPALGYLAQTWAIEGATCAKLFTYPDA